MLFLNEFFLCNISKKGSGKMNDINRILVLAPHTDDGEFGCGGSVATTFDYISFAKDKIE